MRHISFRNGVLVVPIGELETGTPNVTKLEFYISPAERMIFLSRQNSQKTTRLHVIIDPGSTTHRGYKVEVLKLITKGNEQQVVVVEKYAILSQNGHFLVGNNFPNRDYDIGELVAKICYRRNEA